MFKIMISIIILLILVGFLFGLQVEFKPFKISFTSWKEGICWVLIMVGFSAYIGITSTKAKYEGYVKGYEDGGNYVVDKVIEKVKEKK